MEVDDLLFEGVLEVLRSLTRHTHLFPRIRVLFVQDIIATPTYRNRYANGEAGDYRRLVEDAVNRRFDCLVVCGGNRLGPSERAAFFLVGRFLAPAGFRVVDVAEGWDTEASGGRAYAFHLRGMSRTERRAERRSEDGAQEQED